MAGCPREQVEPNERIMSNVMKPGEGAETQKQELLEKWTVAKVPQWLKAGLMEHIVELVVVDDQVRQAVTDWTALTSFSRLSLGLQSFLSYLTPHHCALCCYQMTLGHVMGWVPRPSLMFHS
jgi:hypothetical protein